jgi:hypothetical protein
MTLQHRYLVLAALSSAGAAACSDNGAPRLASAAVGGTATQTGDSANPAEAGAGAISGLEAPTAGAAGSGDAPATVGNTCTAAGDCDDARPCNGQELCIENTCQIGSATTCSVGMECSDDDAGKCIFTDPSPWIIYQADDDTPGVPEVYAVKRGLLGLMEPIKLNAPLAEGWEIGWGGTWAPDHMTYSFNLLKREPYQQAVQVVRFGQSGPEPAIQLEGSHLQWSRSGTSFALVEPHGVALYTCSKAGKLELGHRVSDPKREQYYGWWAHSDAFTFASQLTADQRWDIFRTYLDGNTWQNGAIIQGQNLAWFSVNPNLTEIIYEADERSVFALSLTRAISPRSFAGPGWRGLVWSSDAQRYLLFTQPPAASESHVYLGTGEVIDGNMQEVAQGRNVVSGGFSPDGKYLQLRQTAPDWGQQLSVYELSTGAWSSPGYRISNIDGVAWSPDGGWLAMSDRQSETSDIELQLLGVGPGNNTIRVDTIPANLRYLSLQFSKGGDFFAYYKGDSASGTYDAAYVDLRYRRAPKSVRLPGEGMMSGMKFDPDGSGLYYIRQRDNGARDCFYLDLSRQVAQDPVKVNRDGRVDDCNAQPLTE